jgi:hypothetical protein
VLQNWRKHIPGARGLDPRSSAPWFTGWRTAVTPTAGSAPVVAARTWLARAGWRRHGLLNVDEHPLTQRVGRNLRAPLPVRKSCDRARRYAGPP